MSFKNSTKMHQLSVLSHLFPVFLPADSPSVPSAVNFCRTVAILERRMCDVVRKRIYRYSSASLRFKLRLNYSVVRMFSVVRAIVTGGIEAWKLSWKLEA